MQQAAVSDCLSFDPFPFDQNGLAPPEVDVGGRQVGDALVISQVIVAGDEGLDLGFEIAQQVIADIHQIAAGSFANLPRFRRFRQSCAVGAGCRWGRNEPASCRALKIAEFSVIEAHLSREFGSDA